MVAELEQRLDDSPEVRKAIEVIRRNVELEAHLIDDLLDVTRIVHNKLELEPAVLDAHETIKRSLEICQEDIRGKKLDVVLDLRATRFYVNADPARLQQVFWNLIKNAVKFTLEGRITITSRNEGSKFLVEVADTGIGIDPDGLDKIFKAFEQVERSITRRFGGLGLGLAISKAMVDAHGGRLWAASDGQGRGAVFTVELETVDAVLKSPSPARVPTDGKDGSDGAGGRRRILVVDDHQDTCMGMKLLLERRGYSVRIANNVASALTLAAQDNLDLVISDLGLPDGTGFDLMEKIRQRSDIKGIALSGFGTEEDVARSQKAGFTEHLIKPINLETLDAILKRIFD
jgi:two-component system CheB/CheR fusion protein